MKAKSILVPLESYLYLNRKRREERDTSGKPLNEERVVVNFNRFAHGGYKRLMDGDYGGCIGKAENGYKEGRWTSWSCEDMKRILTEAGLPYKDGEDVEYIQL